jgi:hypothetical protein
VLRNQHPNPLKQKVRAYAAFRSGSTIMRSLQAFNYVLRNQQINPLKQKV